MIEGTQGYGLSLNHGPYPYVTSRDIIASSLLSDVGLSPRLCTEIVMVVRTYPIRVAGNSGPMHDELTWGDVTRESGADHPLTEQTTVTKRVRRVGHFDMQQVLDAVSMNRPDYIALTFADYINNADFGKKDLRLLSPSTRSFITYLEDKTKTRVALVKTGPDIDQIVDMRKWRTGAV